MEGYPANAMLIAAWIGISLIGPLFGTLGMFMTFRISSSLGHLTNNITGLKAVGITTDLAPYKC